jgi:putative transposase
VDGVLEYLKALLKRIREYYPEVEIDKVNGNKNHVHFLISIPPKMAVGAAVRVIKSNTAKALREKFPFIHEVHWKDDGIWSYGYFVSTVGINEQTIRKYIEKQGKEDSGQAMLEL